MRTNLRDSNAQVKVLTPLAAVPSQASYEASMTAPERLLRRARSPQQLHCLLGPQRATCTEEELPVDTDHPRRSCAAGVSLASPLTSPASKPPRSPTWSAGVVNLDCLSVSACSNKMPAVHAQKQGMADVSSCRGVR